MDDTINITQASKKWGIPPEIIFALCDNRSIEGVFKFGNEWWIPSDSVKPSDELIEKVRNDYNNSFAKEEKIAEQRKKSFNGLCASEWANHSRSVWNDVSSTREKKHLDHGATYPEK